MKHSDESSVLFILCLTSPLPDKRTPAFSVCLPRRRGRRNDSHGGPDWAFLIWRHFRALNIYCSSSAHTKRNRRFLVRARHFLENRIRSNARVVTYSAFTKLFYYYYFFFGGIWKDMFCCSFCIEPQLLVDLSTIARRWKTHSIAFKKKCFFLVLSLKSPEMPQDGNKALSK